MQTLKLKLPPSILDVNRNGRLTPLELAIYFANASVQMEISTVDEYNAGFLINQYDRDADGSLNKAELVAFPYHGDLQAIDSNDNAEVTSFELATWFATVYKEKGVDARDHRMAVASINKLDTDEDLRLNTAEAELGTWPIDPWKLDANRNKHLEAGEIASVFSAFKRDAGIENGHETGADRAMNRYDKNRDGKLDQDEIERGGWPKDWVTFDSNEDRVVTSFELAAGFARKQRALGVTRPLLDQAAEVIRRYDRNRNGEIDLSELLEHRADVGVLDADGFLEIDTDGNQKISKVELATHFVKDQADRP
jgi:Ca2+-binding EF-hand superfamily protein